MNKTVITLLTVFLVLSGFGQANESEKLIELGKAYKDFMFRNEPPKGFLKDLQAGAPDNLKPAVNFISQTITTDNDLLKTSLARTARQPVIEIHLYYTGDKL